MNNDNTNNMLRSGTYLIPSLLTAFNLVCGILAILLSVDSFSSGTDLHHNYTLASWLILAAMVFDYLDGKIARLIHATSDFGVKIDSLCDFVTFGIAPVVVAYAALLQQAPFALQSIACIAFLFAGAWRLARFNCESCDAPSSYSFFTGLPIPAASAVVCTVVLITPGNETTVTKLLGNTFGAFNPALTSLLVSLLMLGLAFLMVSRIPFMAFKKINRRNLIVFGGVGVFFGVLSFILPLGNIVFLLMMLYLLIGLYQYFLERVLRLQPKHTN